MDEKTPSSWDDLLNQIGAEAAPDAGQRRRPAIETRFEPPPASARPAAKPKPKPGNWNALASELGVEAPPEAPPARASRPAPGPGAMEASFASIEPIESPFEEIIEEEISEVDFSEGDSDDILFEDDDSDLDDDDSDFADDEVASGDDLPPSALSGEAARSAFEALFQAGAGGVPPRAPQPPRERSRRREPVDDIFGDEPAPRSARPARPERPERPARQERPARPERPERPARSASPERAPQAEGDRPAEDEGDRPRRRRRRGGRGRGRERDPADAPRKASTDEPVARDDSDLEDETWQSADDAAEPRESAATDDESGSDEERGDRSGRRRRSRRGRGRRSTADAGAAEGGGEKAETREVRPPTRNGRGPQRAKVDDDDDDDDDDDLAALTPDADDDDDDDGDGPPSRSTHKSIPSWSEAIGVMVDVNMQSRKNAPQRPSSPRGGARGRGRGRGGRGGGRGGRPS